MLTSLPIFWHKPFTSVSAYTCTCVCELFLGTKFWCIFSSENFGKICFSSTILTKFSVLLGKSLPIFWPHQIEKKKSLYMCVLGCVCVCACACVLKEDSFGKIPNISHYKELWSGKYCPLLFISMLPTLTYNLCTIRGDEFHRILTNFLIFL
jgi:hypothetical protein